MSHSYFKTLIGCGLWGHEYDERASVLGKGWVAHDGASRGVVRLGNGISTIGVQQQGKVEM